MKAYFMFTGTGPLVILTSYDTIENPNLLERLSSKGINKFVACAVSVDIAKAKYGNHFDVVCRDLYETDDLRVLDYNGHRAFNSFSFSELGAPIYYDRSEALAARLGL